MLHHRAGRLCNPNCSIRSHPLLYTRIYLCICVEHICCTFWIQICVKYICSTFWSVFVSHLVELVGIDLESNELHSFWCSYHLCFAYFPPCILSRFSVYCFKARTHETKSLLMQRVFRFCVNAKMPTIWWWARLFQKMFHDKAIFIISAEECVCHLVKLANLSVVNWCTVDMAHMAQCLLVTLHIWSC